MKKPTLLTILGLLVYSYFFVISFSDTFSLSSWFTLPVTVLTLVVGMWVFRFFVSPVIYWPVFYPEDILLVIMLLVITASAIFYPSIKSLNYLLAYFFVFGVGYLLLKQIIAQNVDLHCILIANAAGMAFVAVFVVCDFFFFNVLEIDIQSYLPRHREARAFYAGLFRRSYGFATEPTILSFYFNTLGLVGLSTIVRRQDRSRLVKAFVVVIYLIASVSTFSAAGFAALASSVLIAGCFFVGRRFLTTRFFSRSASFATVAFLILIIVIGWQFVPFFEGIVKKLSGDVYSAQIRFERWGEAFTAISQNPLLGEGIGFLSSLGQGSSLNWYFFLAREAGLLAPTAALGFLSVAMYRIAVSPIPGRAWYLVACGAGIIHLGAIGSFHHPFLWALLALFYAQHSTTYRWGQSNLNEPL